MYDIEGAVQFEMLEQDDETRHCWQMGGGLEGIREQELCIVGKKLDAASIGAKNGRNSTAHEVAKTICCGGVFETETTFWCAPKRRRWNRG